MASDKVWFVTGASRGFGLALVKLLLSNGTQVAATSRDLTALKKAVGEEFLTGGVSGNLLPLAVDITSEKSVQDAIRQTVDKFGRLDVVVNNAGYAILGSLEELTDQEFRQTMDVNVVGTVHVIRAAMPYLREQRSGYIINFSSSGGYYGVGHGGSYAAAKFAVVGLSEALAQEVAPFGVKVTVVAPGYFRTSFLEKSSVRLAANKIKGYFTDQLEAAMEKMNGNQPGDPEKLVAALVVMAEEPDPPVHLLMGPDAYKNVTEKRKVEDAEFEAWKQVTLSTDIEG